MNKVQPPVRSTTWATNSWAPMRDVTPLLSTHLSLYTSWRPICTGTSSRPQMSRLALSQISTLVLWTHGTLGPWCMLALNDPSKLSLILIFKPQQENYLQSIDFTDNFDQPVDICGFNTSHTSHMAICITLDQINDFRHPVRNVYPTHPVGLHNSFHNHNFYYSRGCISITAVSEVTDPFPPLDLLNRENKSSVLQDGCRVKAVEECTASKTRGDHCESPLIWLSVGCPTGYMSVIYIGSLGDIFPNQKLLY